MERVIISGKHVSFKYQKEYVFKDINFDIYNKEFLGIIGPNGGGKTTFIKLLLGILKPMQTPYFSKNHNFLDSKLENIESLDSKNTTDSIESNSKNIESNPQNTESKPGIFYPHPELFSSPKQIGYVPQNTQINLNFPIMAIEVVEMGFLESKMLGFRVKKKQREIAMQNLEKLGIAHLAFKKIGELSGGERQRVLIARAISGDKKLLILDEPTSNIDAKTQKEIYKILKRINEFHTIISISHDIPITLEYATRILYINKQIHSHEVPKLELNSDGHICEIDIFQDFANVLRR